MQLREYGQPAPDHSPDAESLAGLYAFGILEGAELARFERHLVNCGRCAEVVASDQAVVSTLSLTAPEVEPSPDLKVRLLERAAAETRADPRTGVGGPRSSGPVPPRSRRGGTARTSWLLALAAIMLALLAGAGLLSRELGSAQIVTAVALENRADRGRAEVLVRSSGEGVIRLNGFEDLDDGRVYQAWVIREGSRPFATGATTSGNGTMTLDGDVRGTKVAVTIEAGPGAQVPNVPPFVIGPVPPA